MAQGQYRFTGNPKVAQYEPRGLEYFTYLPQLKAKVRGAALESANKVVFDNTGLYKTDLEPANKMTGAIEATRDKVVDDLLGGSVITDATVDRLSSLARQKSSADKLLKEAHLNAKKIQDFNTKWDNYGAVKRNFLYAGRVKEEAAKAFGSTFNPDGTVNQFEGFTPPNEIDITGKIKEAYTLAQRNMTPEQRGSFNKNDFAIIKVDTGMIDQNTGKTITSYQLTYKNPKDKFENTDALDDALATINGVFSDPNSEEFQYLKFMGEEYTAGKMEEAKAMKSLYELEDERASGWAMSSLGTDKTAAKPGGGGGSNLLNRPDPFKLYQASINASVPKDPLVLPKTAQVVNPNTGFSFDNIFKGVTNKDIKSKGPLVIDEKQYDSYATKTKQLTTTLFGENMTLHNIRNFKQAPETQYTGGNAITPEDPYTVNNRVSPFARITREAYNSPPGTYGRVYAVTLNDAIDELAVLAEEHGYNEDEELPLHLTQEELKDFKANPKGDNAAFYQARIDVLEAGTEMYNKTITESANNWWDGDLENTSERSRLMFNDPSWFNTNVSGNKLLTQDTYKEHALPRLLKDNKKIEVLKYTIDPGSKSGSQYKFQGSSWGEDKGEKIQEEFKNHLNIPDHTAPRTFAKAYDFGKDTGKTGTDRDKENQYFDQAFAYETLDPTTGVTTMYVAPNQLYNQVGVREPDKYALVMEDNKVTKTRVQDIALNIEPGVAETFMLPFITEDGGVETNTFKVLFTGGQYTVTNMTYPNSPPSVASSRQQLNGIFADLAQTPELQQMILQTPIE